ncbi:protein of unknown function [Pseudomonas sp. JV241A]|nr:protein of unknown function [Pseudomonas sp. JV241A]
MNLLQIRSCLPTTLLPRQPMRCIALYPMRPMANSLLYHQPYNVRLMWVIRLEDDVFINIMIETSTLGGFIDTLID